jgi:hypothetical protein
MGVAHPPPALRVRCRNWSNRRAADFHEYLDLLINGLQIYLCEV